MVLPDGLGIARAHEAFNEDGSLKDAKQQQGVEALAAKLVVTIRRLKNEAV
jgi:chromate reductase, NAD(P)H dehydrogenase (quinone)